jgi:hypothetical protein
MPDRVIYVSGQSLCEYCGRPFAPRMVPVTVPSRAHGEAQFWLHPDCLRAAFAGAAGPPLDVDDMTVDVPPWRPDGRRRPPLPGRP